MFRYDHNTMSLEVDLLTQREAQVLYWLVRGYDNVHIADILFVDEKTVQTHINSVYNKLRISRTLCEGQAPRTALSWLLWRTGQLKRISSEGHIDGRKDHVHGFNEQEILISQLLKLEHTNKDIAKTMRVSPPTIAYHIHNMSLKLGLNGQFGSNTQAKRKALLERLP